MPSFVVDDAAGWKELASGGLPASGVSAGTNGDSTHVAQVTVNAQGQVTAASDVAISASAGVSSLDTITGDVTLTAGSGITITDNSPSAGDITITATGAGAGGFAVVAYQEFTSNVPVTGTTEGGATTIVTAGAFTPDGTSAYLVEFYACEARPNGAAGGTLTVYLYLDGSSIGRICGVVDPAAASMFVPLYGARRLIPSNASHTFSVRAADNAGSGRIDGGAGGSGNLMPGYIMVTRLA